MVYSCSKNDGQVTLLERDNIFRILSLSKRVLDLACERGVIPINITPPFGYKLPNTF